MSAPEKIWVNTDDSEDGCCPVETDLDDVGKYFNASRATCYTRTDLMPPAADYVAEGLAHIVEYTNWRGETARRVVRPIRMWWGKTERHPEEQWMLTAWDCEKEAIRDFAWQDMRPVQNPATSAAALVASPASPDTRVVTVAQLVAWLECVNGLFPVSTEEIRAIIGGQDRG